MIHWFGLSPPRQQPALYKRLYVLDPSSLHSLLYIPFPFYRIVHDSSFSLLSLFSLHITTLIHTHSLSSIHHHDYLERGQARQQGAEGGGEGGNGVADEPRSVIGWYTKALGSAGLCPLWGQEARGKRDAFLSAQRFVRQDPISGLASS